MHVLGLGLGFLSQGNPYPSPSSYAGMYLWANADHATLSSTTLTNWQDSSGAGHDLSNCSGSPAPQSGGNVNGYPAILFDTSKATQAETSVTPLTTTFDNFSAVVAFELSAFEAYGRLLTNDYTNGFFLGFDSSGEALMAVVNGSPLATIVSSPLSLATPYIGSLFFDSTTPGSGLGTAYLYVNGTLVSSGTCTPPIGSTNEALTVGNDASSAQGITGAIRHAALWTDFYSGSNLTAIHRWFGYDCGITVP